MASQEPWVKVEEIATHLCVSKDTVYRWIEEMGLPAHRVGRLFRFKVSEIDQWVHHSESNNDTNSEKA